MTVLDPVRVFAALGDPTRMRLVRTLARDGSASERSLAAPLPITRQAVGKHLRVLTASGLVSATRSGRETRYRLEPSGIREAESLLDRIGREWERQLRLVKDAAEDADPAP